MSNTEYDGGAEREYNRRTEMIKGNSHCDDLQVKGLTDG